MPSQTPSRHARMMMLEVVMMMVMVIVMMMGCWFSQVGRARPAAWSIVLLMVRAIEAHGGM